MIGRKGSFTRVIGALLGHLQWHHFLDVVFQIGPVGEWGTKQFDH